LVIKGIKIKIKGRINRRPRAKYRIITIGNIPFMTLKSDIDYSETTAYTSNGTLGVKVWICHMNRKKLTPKIRKKLCGMGQNKQNIKKLKKVN
jgi:ribosomal protein S3